MNPDLVEAVARAIIRKRQWWGTQEPREGDYELAKAALKAHEEWLASPAAFEAAGQIWPHVGPVTQRARIETARELLTAAKQPPETPQSPAESEMAPETRNRP